MWRFQFLLILDLLVVSFHAVAVFGLGKDLLLKSVLGHCALCTKGQLISKAKFQAVDSPKKRTNEFAFFDFKSCYVVKSNAIHLFFWRIYCLTFCFRN